MGEEALSSGEGETEGEKDRAGEVDEGESGEGGCSPSTLTPPCAVLSILFLTLSITSRNLRM